MASLSWLYDKARSEPSIKKPIKKKKVAEKKKIKPEIKVEKVLEKAVVKSEIKVEKVKAKVKSSARKSKPSKNDLQAQLEELGRYAGEKLGLNELQPQQMLQATEAQLHKLSARAGMDLPSDMVVPAFSAIMLALAVIAMIVRKMKNRRRHRELYGDNAFPPYTRCGMLETIAGLSGRKQPWFFQKCSEQVGPVFRLRVPNIPGKVMFVAVGDLDTVKEILQDPKTTKPEELYTSIAKICGGGPNIVTSEGGHWTVSRTGVTPAFAKKHLDHMNQVCKEKTEEWIGSKLEPSIISGKSFNIGKEFLGLTWSILCKAAFEYKFNKKEADAMTEEFDIVCREVSFNESVVNPWRVFIIFGFLLPSRRRARLAQSRIRDFAKRILESHRKKPLHLRRNEDTIISCIDKNKKYQSDDQRIDDIVMFLFGGHESTAHSLSWILLELARHPDEMKRLRQAIRGDDDFLAQTMLKDVLREGLRLRPVVSSLGIRTTGRDFYLKDKAIVIPKGSQVVFPTMVMTRFGVEDAEEFRPSRWREHPDKSFLSFATGRRNCVGQSLALAEITWVLSRLCAQYDFEVVKEGRADYCKTIRCVGAKLKAHRIMRKAEDATDEK